MVKLGISTKLAHYPLQQQAFNERALLLGDRLIFWMADKSPVTPLAALILFADMDMTIALIPG